MATGPGVETTPELTYYHRCAELAGNNGLCDGRSSVGSWWTLASLSCALEVTGVRRLDEALAATAPLDNTDVQYESQRLLQEFQAKAEAIEAAWRAFDEEHPIGGDLLFCHLTPRPLVLH